MQWNVTDDVEAYAGAVTPFLEREPCARNVLHWVIELARSGAGGWSAPPVFAWLSGPDGTPLAAASWTPPFNVQVSEMPAGAERDLVEAILGESRRAGRRLAGVSGPEPAASTVAHEWERRT